MQYNESHGLKPKQIVKAVSNILPTTQTGNPIQTGRKTSQVYIEPEFGAFAADPIVRRMTRPELEKSIANTTELMKEAARNLDFLQAAQYRDELARLKEQLELK